MSAGIRALLEQIGELNCAIREEMELPDDFDISEAYVLWEEMTQDPTWYMPESPSRPPSFYDYLQDCKA